MCALVLSVIKWGQSALQRCCNEQMGVFEHMVKA